MLAFFSRYSFIFIFIGVMIVVGIIFGIVFQQNTHLPTNVSPKGVSQYAVAPAAPLPPPPAPTVSMTIIKSKSGNKLLVQWANLPQNTSALNIYRGLSSKPSSTWAIFKTISIDDTNFAGGSENFDIGTSLQAGYSFFIQAVNDNVGNSSSTNGTPITTVTFTSGVIVPPVTTAPPPTNNTPPGNGTPSTTQTQTPGNNTPPPPPSQTNNTPPPPPSTDIPYYNPQLQLSGTQPKQTGSFLVQHVDQKIQIAWQNLPTSTTGLAIYRSPNQDGPWSLVLSQQSPGVLDSYSIQLVDDTLGAPFYYEMLAQNGSTTIGTYGPIFLQPGQ